MVFIRWILPPRWVPSGCARNGRSVYRCSAVVVKQYGGTVNQFTGDGLMAVFGAPIALEDHAFRACLAALDIQQEAQRLGAMVERRDGVVLLLRIGLNSGEVIAGEMGSGPGSYTTIGEQVGIAQRMESVAPPGGVMLSESTARLVEGVAELGELEKVPIKGAVAPVPARRLLAAAEAVADGRQCEVDRVGADEPDEEAQVGSDQGKRGVKAEPFRGHAWTLGAECFDADRSVSGRAVRVRR